MPNLVTLVEMSEHFNEFLMCCGAEVPANSKKIKKQFTRSQLR